MAQIVFRRSSTYPIEYALLLQLKTPAGWKTQIVADNAHEREHVDEHHFHRYIGGEKQDPEPLPFSVDGTNDAMGKIVQWFKDDWKELIK